MRACCWAAGDGRKRRRSRSDRERTPQRKISRLRGAGGVRDEAAPAPVRRETPPSEEAAGRPSAGGGWGKPWTVAALRRRSRTAGHRSPPPLWERRRVGASEAGGPYGGAGRGRRSRHANRRSVSGPSPDLSGKLIRASGAGAIGASAAGTSCGSLGNGSQSQSTAQPLSTSDSRPCTAAPTPSRAPGPRSSRHPRASRAPP